MIACLHEERMPRRIWAVLAAIAVVGAITMAFVLPHSAHYTRAYDRSKTDADAANLDAIAATYHIDRPVLDHDRHFTATKNGRVVQPECWIKHLSTDDGTAYVSCSNSPVLEVQN